MPWRNITTPCQPHSARAGVDAPGRAGVVTSGRAGVDAPGRAGVDAPGQVGVVTSGRAGVSEHSPSLGIANLSWQRCQHQVFLCIVY